MKGISLFQQDWFWNTLRYLENLRKDVPLFELVSHLNIQDQQLFELFIKLGEIGATFEIKERDGVKYLSPPHFKKLLPLTLAEWMAISITLSSKSMESPFYQMNPSVECEAIVSQLQKKYSEFDLSKIIKPETYTHAGINLESLSIINTAIEMHALLDIKMTNGHTLLLPERVIYLEGELVLIGVNCQNHHLEMREISSLMQIQVVLNHQYRSQYSSLQVDDFLSASREVTGDTDRIVLKILLGANIDLAPTYHFFEKTYTTANAEGELIWAATVEPSMAFYDWLWSIKEKIIILDSSKIKSGFMNYCEERCENELSLLKKVS